MQQTHWFSHWGCKHIFLTTEAANTDFQTEAANKFWTTEAAFTDVYQNLRLQTCTYSDYFGRNHLKITLSGKFFQPLRLQAQISNPEAVDIDFLLLKPKTDFQTRRWKTQIFSYCGCKQSLFLVQHWSCKQRFSTTGAVNIHTVITLVTATVGGSFPDTFQLVLQCRNHGPRCIGPCSVLPLREPVWHSGKVIGW